MADIIGSWQQMLQMVPSSVAVVCVGIPLNRARTEHQDGIRHINQKVSELCAARSGRFLSVVPGEGRFSGASFGADGIHLDQAGSLALSAAIQQVLSGEAE